MGAMSGGAACGQVGAPALRGALGAPVGAACVTLPAEAGALDALREFADAVCDEHGASARVRFDVQLALEELFVNVVSHGFAGGLPREDVWLAAWAEPAGDAAPKEELRLVMSDAGVPYDPLAFCWQKAQAARGEANTVGGLGILLVRERMDGVSYERRDGRNVVSLTKRLRAESE